MPTYTWDHIHLRSPDPEATAQWFGAEVIRSMHLVARMERSVMRGYFWRV